jgi:hypothetical protein
MNTGKKAAVLAAVLLALLVCFQLLLAAGLPLGRAAWGGGHRVLPASLRWGSLAAAIVLAALAYAVLVRAGLAGSGGRGKFVRASIRVFTVYFALNTVMNALSVSSYERYIMTPASAALVVCMILVARS